MNSANKPRSAAVSAASSRSKVKTSSKRRSQRRPRGVSSPRMLGLAPASTNPRTSQRMSTSRDGHSCRFRGTDFVKSIDSGAGLVAGQVITTLAANPRMIGVSRLAIASSVWERFKFRSLKFHYAPIANATQSGSLIGYVDYDVEDVPTGTGDANLQRAWAAFGQQSCQIWGDPSKRTSWDLRDLDPMTDLYIDSPSEDPHWTSQGLYVLLSASTVAAGIPLGNIFVEYDVEFFIPQIELTPLSGVASMWVNASPTTSALFTAGVAKSWNNSGVTATGNVLTLPAAGNYLLSWDCAGVGLTSCSFTSSIATSVAGNNLLLNSGATGGRYYSQLTATASGALTFTFAATSLSSLVVYVALLPTNATTLALGAKLKKLESLLSEFKSLQASALESKEARELAPVVISREPSFVPVTPYNSPSASTSSVVSGVSGPSLSGGWFRA